MTSTPSDDPLPTADQPVTETLEAFKNSFFYGSRSDLNLKFLAELSPEDAGAFITDMLTGITHLIDGGEADHVVQRFVDWQRRAYGDHLDQPATYRYDDVPFARPDRRLVDSRVALVTSSGHFVDGDDPRPFGEPDMTQAEAEARIREFLRAEPSLSAIAVDADPAQLRVRHGGYPVDAVRADHQVALPIGHLVEAAERGLIGELAPTAYSFVGATSQLRLRDRVAPDWAEMLRAQDVDLALLIPV